MSNATDPYTRNSFKALVEELGEYEPDFILEAVATYFANASQHHANVPATGYTPRQAAQYSHALLQIKADINDLIIEHQTVEAVIFA